MRVMVADDSPALRAAVSRLLQGAGHEVEEAADGAEAIAGILADPPDAVLLDLHMPRVTGWVVCRVLKENPALCRIPVLVLTGLEAAEDRFWAEKSGADGYLTKDQIGTALLDRLHAVAASRALADLSRGPAARAEEGPADVLARVCEVLDRNLFEATVVNEITSIAVRSLDLRQSLDEVLTAVGRLVAYDVGALGLLSERLMAVRHSRPLAPTSVDAFSTGMARAMSDVAGADLTTEDLACWGQGLQEAMSVEAVPACTWSSWYAGPLRARGRALGALVLAAEAPGRFDDRVQRTLRAITPAMTAVIEVAREFQRAITDEVEASFSSL